MNNPMDSIQASLRLRLSQIAEEIGQETVVDIKEALGRQYPPSGPANVGPPAHRTGNLQAGVDYTVADLNPTTIRITISSIREPEARKGSSYMVPEWLENGIPESLERGTPRVAPRPYMGPAADRVAETLAQKVATKLSM
jgi:hypothetical protein